MVYEICGRCGKMFPKNGSAYCEDCFEKTEKELDLILEYISKYPEATILEIITQTGVTLKSINCLVKQGHVSYVENKLERSQEVEVEDIEKIMDKNNKFYTSRNR